MRPCNAKAIRADKLETIVYKWVEKVISDPEFIKQLYAKTLEKRKQNEIPLRDRLDSLTLEKFEAETRLKRVARLMMDASETELSIYQPEVESLRNTIEYLAGILVGIEDELNQSEVDAIKFNDFVEYVAAVQSVISNKHDDYGFKEKAIRAIDLKVVVSLNQQSVRVECVLGSDILPLYEDQKNGGVTVLQRQMEPDSDVWIFNVSRTRYMDQMP